MVNNLTERELKILSYLIDEDDFINGDDLSSRLGISKKTIQREIGSMNEILKDENCAIESVPSKGYRLGKDEKLKLINVLFLTKDKDQVIPTTQQSRQEWLIHKFISLSFNDEPVTLQKLCDKLYISMTSLKYDLKRLKGIFEKYDLELVKRENKGLILKGEENKVRKLIVASLNSEHTNYPFAFELANILGKDIEEAYGVSVNEDEIGFLAIHFCGALERLNSSKETSVKALIVCSTGIGTSFLLKSKINAKFKDKIEILDVCAMYQIKTYPEDEYDLIISTIPLEAKKDSIVVTPLLNEDDIEQINRYLKYGNDQFKPIKNLFVSELFFPDIDLDNREDIIEFMSDQLLEKGYIDQECKESYKKRENMATTEIGNLVSVPHSMDGKIYKSAICVGILNKPIQWEYGMVQIVLMIAVRKEDIHKENEFFLHVYQKFDPLYKAKKSISMKNIEYIRQQFTEEEFI